MYQKRRCATRSAPNFVLLGVLKAKFLAMGAEGLEPSRPCSQRILSPLRLPFRHAPVIR